jgi:hypothetical protein
MIDQIPPGDLTDTPFLDKHPMFSKKLRISVKRGSLIADPCLVHPEKSSLDDSRPDKKLGTQSAIPFGTHRILQCTRHVDLPRFGVDSLWCTRGKLGIRVTVWPILAEEKWA